MKVKVLASGSKGNVTYVEDNDTKILIDIGMRCCYIEEKLRDMGVEPSTIDAILITHIHNDHTLGLHTFARKYKTLTYMTPNMQKDLDAPNVKYITREMTIKGINVKVFRTSHDVESYGYIIQDSLVYITDTGYINNKYFDMLSNKKIYIMESNHDIEMLESGPYPYHLKQRIWSDKGHLSNEMSSEYLSKFIGDNTKVVVLAHLSETNNTEEKALEEFRNRNRKDVRVLLGKPKETTELIEV